MAQLTNIEWDLLEQAIEACYRETGLRLVIKQRQVMRDGRQLDAILQIEGYDQTLVAEVKKWAQQANLGALVNQVKALPMEGILVADYVNPNMADKLREQNVQFIDVVGNVYLNKPPVYAFVKGNRQQNAGPTNKKEGTGRAFEATGLKVIYAFLCNPELVNVPYRNIANTAAVALGTVGWILYDLKAAGFVIDRGGKRGRRLVRYRELLNRWIAVYPIKLRPKLELGEYIADDPYWWKNIDIQQYQAYWGGEVAAAKYTNYLKPEEVIIYLPEKAGYKLFVALKLRKATEWTENCPGKIRIYRPFWTKQNDLIGLNDFERAGIVHPILAYADLVATGDTRNLEAARIIFDKYIDQYIREA
ncbi:MAG: type IV toxin-antitoxin system AbiEi family antitoxin [Candidatus Glassbacteria bacterium]